MDIGTRIKTMHCGEVNAIKSPALEKIYHCSGADIRKQINELRRMGNPICSTRKGYFYASSVQEATTTIKQLESRATRITEAKNGILRGIKGSDLNG